MCVAFSLKESGPDKISAAGLSLDTPICSSCCQCLIKLEQIGGGALNAYVVLHQERHKLLAIHERNGGLVGLRGFPRPRLY